MIKLSQLMDLHNSKDGLPIIQYFYYTFELLEFSIGKNCITFRRPYITLFIGWNSDQSS